MIPPPYAKNQIHHWRTGVLAIVLRNVGIRAAEAQTWHPIYPDLFVDLRARANETLSSRLEQASAMLRDSASEVRDKVKIRSVNVRPELRMKSCIAADSSSYPLPFAISRMALIGAIAIRHPTRQPVSVAGRLLELEPKFSFNDFQVYLGAVRESMIPRAVLDQLSRHGPADIILIDGPLSISQWYNLASADVARMAVLELIQSRNDLLNLGAKDGVDLIGVVKRSESMYFQKAYGLSGSLSDQFLFNQVLKFGERTDEISITEQIISAATGATLVEKMDHLIYGFYIKTSRNPLTPPLRIEYPDYVRDRVDDLASYVLSTSLESFDFKYDGLPQAQCIAHRDGKVTKDAMLAIVQEQIAKMSSSEESLRLLSFFTEQRGV